mgnify:CR=1 FL=1
MARFVRFNVACRVGGNPYSIGQEVIIDDVDFDQLSRMTRRREPYVVEIELPSKGDAASEEKAENPIKKRRKRKETAKSKSPETAD